MKKSITNGKLRIILDEDHLKNTKDRLLEEWDEEDLECEIPLDQRTYEGEINRLYQLAKDIMTSAEIFDYLPTTKSGCFHKTKNILVADSKVKFWNEYGTLMMALKLKQQPYHAVITPVPKGNGNEMYLELDWFYLKPSEQSLYDHSGHIKKLVSTPKAKYIPLHELQPGYLYEAKNGQVYLYLGVRKIYGIPHFTLDPDEEWCSFEHWANAAWRDWLKHQLCVVKYTKTKEKQLEKCKTISDVFHVLSDHEERKFWIQRNVEMPASLQFVKCLRKLVEDDQKDQVIPYTVSDIFIIRNNKTDTWRNLETSVEMDQHIDFHQDSSTFLSNKKGDLQIILSSKQLEESRQNYWAAFKCSIHPVKEWGMNETQWEDAWNEIKAKIQALIEDPDFIDQIPLKRNGTFPDEICIWKSNLINSCTKKQICIYLKAYSIREELETFTGTNFTIVPNKMAYLYIDRCSTSDIPILS